MRLRVDEIPESGRVLHFHWDAEQFGRLLPPEDSLEMHLLHPIHVDLELNRFPEHVRIQGTIRGALELTCHRCLSPVAWPLEEQVDLLLLPEQQVSEEEEERLEEEEVDFEFFDGEVIDVDHLVAEQIFLGLPFKVLCSEECRGLCPRCGANLNEEPCRCPEDSSGSPFTKLVELKNRLPGSRKS